jgi:hypothetical protein
MELPVESSYKYLGIWLSNDRNYLAQQEAVWFNKARQVMKQMHAKSLWKFNKFEITRVQWKATAVPALTYANSVTVMSRGLQRRLEQVQREAGRWALGQPSSKLANEFIEGELGWSSFEAREAQSKLRYVARVEAMADNRWPKLILNMMSLVNIQTQSLKRANQLRSRFGCGDIEPTRSEAGELRLGLFNRTIKEQIKQVQNEEWREKMPTKSTLERYRTQKRERGSVQAIYDNSRGSTLLAMARSGTLRTRTWRTRYEPGLDPTCTRCGRLPETIRHVILQCGEDHEETEVLTRLGLCEERTQRVLNETKRNLEKWERATRN